MELIRRKHTLDVFYSDIRICSVSCGEKRIFPPSTDIPGAEDGDLPLTRSLTSIPSCQPVSVSLLCQWLVSTTPGSTIIISGVRWRRFSDGEQKQWSRVSLCGLRHFLFITTHEHRGLRIVEQKHCNTKKDRSERWHGTRVVELTALFLSLKRKAAAVCFVYCVLRVGGWKV